MEKLEEQDIISNIELEQEEEIIQAIKENRLYDFISSNYYRIEDNLLLDLLKECIATLPYEKNEDLIDNLKEYKNWEI